MPPGSSLPAKSDASERRADELVLAAVNEASKLLQCARIASRAEMQSPEMRSLDSRAASSRRSVTGGVVWGDCISEGCISGDCISVMGGVVWGNTLVVDRETNRLVVTG